MSAWRQRALAPLLALATVLLLYLLSGVFNAWAQVPDSWKSTPYVVAPEPVPLRQALKDMQAALGIRMEVSPGVGGTLRGSGQAQTVLGFLDGLAQRQGLSWFVFQDRLYVSTLAETASTRLRLDGSRAQDVRSYLAAIRLLDERYVWLPLSASGEVLVEGPPAYVALVSQKARNVPSAPAPAAAPPAEQVELMTFRLWHARAADEDGIGAAIPGITTGRPGVATLLNRLFNPMAAGLAGVGGAVNPQRNVYYELERNREELTAQRQAGWPALRPAGGAASPAVAAAASPAPSAGGANMVGGGAITPQGWPVAPGMGAATGATPALNIWSPATTYDKPEESVTFEADPRTNMVIARAKPSMRRQIETALAALDMPASQIELETVVFDLPLSTMRSVLAELPVADAAVSTPSGRVRRGFVELATAQAVLDRVAAARRGDPSFGIAHQRLVFAEDEKFSLDFDNQLQPPVYSTTIWEGLVGRLIPLKQRPESPRSLGMKLGGTARAGSRRDIRLSLELAESRATPNLSDKTVSAQTVSSALTVNLADGQVLMLMDGTVWSGADMGEPRVRVMFLGARSQPPGGAEP